MFSKNYLYPFFFGLVGIFAFAPFSIKPLIFVSYFYLINSLITTKKNFSQILSWGIGHWSFGMSWIIVSIYYYGETNIATSLIIYILLILLLTLVFTLPLLIINKILKWLNNSRKVYDVVFVSIALLISEWSRYYFLSGVPWLIPGNIFLDTYIQNSYPIFGVFFGSLIIYLFTSSFVFYNKNTQTLIVLILLSALTIFPENKINEDDNYDYQISIVQPASDPFLKYEENYFRLIENNIIELLSKVPKNTDLIILPEAELPYAINSVKFDLFLDKLSKSNELIMGVWLFDKNKLYNAIYNLDNKNLYKKQHLVPFGEYIPFLPKLRGLIQFFELPMSNVSHGGINQEKFSILDNIEVATPICFDIAFAKTVRKINKSSKIMINISNDTWFGNSIGPHQHLSITRIRALENNRWVIRATNDGISGIIDNKGTIVDILDKGKKGLLNGNVNLIDHQSIYNKFGYMIVGVISFIFILILFIMRICKNLY